MKTFDEIKQEEIKKIENEIVGLDADGFNESYRNKRRARLQKYLDNIGEYTEKQIIGNAIKMYKDPKFLKSINAKSYFGISDADINKFREIDEFRDLINNISYRGLKMSQICQDKFLQLFSGFYSIDIPNIADMRSLAIEIKNKEEDLIQLNKNAVYNHSYKDREILEKKIGEERLKLLDKEEQLELDSSKLASNPEEILRDYVISGMRGPVLYEDIKEKFERKRIFCRNAIEKSEIKIQEYNKLEYDKKVKEEREKQEQIKISQEKERQQRYNSAKEKYEESNILKKAFYILSGKAKKVDGSYIVEDEKGKTL